MLSSARVPTAMPIPINHILVRLRRLLGRAEARWGCICTRPQWGSAIDVLDGLLASRRLSLSAVPEQVRQDHVVPATGGADLDDDDLELAVLVCHLLKLRGPLDPPRVLAQLVAENVIEHDHFARLTDRARAIRRLAVILGGPDQQRVRVACVMASKTAPRTTQRLQGCATLQRVVDYLPLRPHGDQSTLRPPLGSTSR